MNPIFTISNSKNLSGYNYDEFTNRFEEICKEHLDDGRAEKFAFIVYDFLSSTHDVLNNTGVFVELDRKSGKDITIFYLDGQRSEQQRKQNRLYKNLNKVFLRLTDQNIQRIPCIVFFDFINGDVENFVYYPFREDEKFILNDLTKAISIELAKINEKSQKKGSIVKSLVSETPKIIYTEFIKLILKGLIEKD